MPGNHQPIIVRDAEVKRLMKRIDEAPSVSIPSFVKEPDHLRGLEREDNTRISGHFSSYIPLFHPVLKSTKAREDKPVNVRFLMGWNGGNSESEYLVDGIERSPFLKLVSLSRYHRKEFTTWTTNKFDKDHLVVWMADVESMERDCHVLEGIVKHVQQNSKEDLPTALVLVDYSGSTERLHCPGIEKLVPKGRIRLTRRNIVRNRYWNPTHAWVQVGELSFNDGDVVSGGPILFSPHLLRDSFVFGLSMALWQANWTNGQSPADLKREQDVAHFWRKDDYSHYTFLRSQVSTIVESLTGEKSNGRKIHTMVNVVGEMEEMEKNVSRIEYVQQLLGTKIVVLAQRDEWEGHHHLLEALASGAMVISDKALAMPNGLHDRKSIVIYDSAHSLKDAIMYYLNPKNDEERTSIARRGWEIAMGQHRSWHRVEEIIFGKALTQVGMPFDMAPAKRKRRIKKEREAEFLRLLVNRTGDAREY